MTTDDRISFCPGEIERLKQDARQEVMHEVREYMRQSQLWANGPDGRRKDAKVLWFAWDVFEGLIRSMIERLRLDE